MEFHHILKIVLLVNLSSGVAGGRAGSWVQTVSAESRRAAVRWRSLRELRAIGRRCTEARHMSYLGLRPGLASSSKAMTE